MVPHETEVYARAYSAGARLRHVPDIVDSQFAKADELAGHHCDVQLRGAAYLIGFCDGWHAAPPLVPPLPEMG